MVEDHPLSWGQQGIYSTIQALGEGSGYLNITRVIAVPDGPSTAELIAAITAVVTEHESLRTLIRTGPDGPRQLLADATRFEVVTVAADGPEQARQRAGSVAAQVKALAFDHAVELPLRCRVVTAAGLPRFVVLVVSHLAVDALGADVLVAELRRRLDPGAPATEPAWQPRQQADYEQGPTARAVSEHAIGRWRETVQALPAGATVPAATAPRRPDRFVELCLTSARAAVAIAELAGRTKASPASVVLAAGCLALGMLDGRPVAAMTLISGNRHRARERRYVGPLVQDALFVQHWADEPFDSFAEQVQRSALAAYSTGRYCPADLRAAVADLAAPVNPTAKALDFFNDARAGSGIGLVSNPDLGRQADSTPYRTGCWPQLDLRRFFVYQQLPGSCRLRLIADTEQAGEQVIAGVLQGIEDVLLRAAAGEPSTGQLTTVLAQAAGRQAVPTGQR
ncbi:MAG: condensation domain-containing protein [Jatrophihabitans sp.]